jgi:hypothetical protein
LNIGNVGGGRKMEEIRRSGKDRKIKDRKRRRGRVWEGIDWDEEGRV